MDMYEKLMMKCLNVAMGLMLFGAGFLMIMAAIELWCKLKVEGCL